MTTRRVRYSTWADGMEIRAADLIALSAHLNAWLHEWFVETGAPFQSLTDLFVPSSLYAMPGWNGFTFQPTSGLIMQLPADYEFDGEHQLALVGYVDSRDFVPGGTEEAPVPPLITVELPPAHATLPRIDLVSVKLSLEADPPVDRDFKDAATGASTSQSVSIAMATRADYLVQSSAPGATAASDIPTPPAGYARFGGLMRAAVDGTLPAGWPTDENQLDFRIPLRQRPYDVMAPAFGFNTGAFKPWLGTTGPAYRNLQALDRNTSSDEYMYSMIPGAPGRLLSLQLGHRGFNPIELHRGVRNDLYSVGVSGGGFNTFLADMTPFLGSAGIYDLKKWTYPQSFPIWTNGLHTASGPFGNEDASGPHRLMLRLLAPGSTVCMLTHYRAVVAG